MKDESNKCNESTNSTNPANLINLIKPTIQINLPILIGEVNHHAVVQLYIEIIVNLHMALGLVGWGEMCHSLQKVLLTERDVLVKLANLLTT